MKHFIIIFSSITKEHAVCVEMFPKTRQFVFSVEWWFVWERLAASHPPGTTTCTKRWDTASIVGLERLRFWLSTLPPSWSSVEKEHVSGAQFILMPLGRRIENSSKYSSSISISLNDMHLRAFCSHLCVPFRVWFKRGFGYRGFQNGLLAKQFIT